MTHLPTQSDLDELWDQTGSIHVFDEVDRPQTPAEAEESRRWMMEELGVRDPKPGNIIVPRFVLDIVDPGDLEQFQQRCRVLDAEEQFASLCLPSYSFVAFDRRDEPIATLKYGPPEILRWTERWESDTNIANTFALADWLDQHGVFGPAERLAEHERQAAEVAAAKRIFIEAAPPGMADDAERLIEAARLQPPDDEGRGVTAEVRDRIRNRHPSQDQQIIHLLRWYGSGHLYGSLSPEFILHTWLMEYSPTTIAAALAGREMAVMRGALRLLAVSDSRISSDDSSALSLDLLGHLTAAATWTGDNETLALARRVLQPIIDRHQSKSEDPTTLH